MKQLYVSDKKIELLNSKKREKYNISKNNFHEVDGLEILTLSKESKQYFDALHRRCRRKGTSYPIKSIDSRGINLTYEMLQKN